MRRALTVAFLALIVLWSVSALADDGSTNEHAPDPNNRYDRIAEQQRELLAPGVSAVMNRGIFGITDTGQTFAYADGSVVLSRAQVQLYVDADPSVGPVLVRLVLAHEYAHVGQAIRYGTFPSASWSRDDVLVREAQADILGSGWLMAELMSDNQDFVNNSPILPAMELMFQLGDGEFAYAHPTNEQRRQAVRFGMAYGTLRFWMIGFQNAQLTPELHRGAAGIIASLSPRLDITGADGEEWDWSLRQARKIVHWRIEGLPFTAESNVQTSPDKSNFIYSITYSNHGAKAIPLDLSVQSVRYAAGVPHDGRISELDASKRYRIVVPANSSQTIFGSIARDSSLGWEPELIFPPDPRSLYCLDEEQTK